MTGKTYSLSSETADGTAVRVKYSLLGVFVGSLCGLCTAWLVSIDRSDHPSVKTQEPTDSASTTVWKLQGGPTGLQYASRITAILDERRRGATLESNRLGLVMELVEAWMCRDPIECLNFLRDSSAEFLIDTENAQAAVSRAAGGDPSRIIALAKDIKSGRIQKQIIHAAFISLAESNPTSALEIHGNLPRYLQAPLGDELAKTWGRADGKNAVVQILKKPQGTESMLGTALAEWAKTDQHGPIDFLITASGEDLHAKLLNRNGLMAGIFGGLNPERVVGVLETLPSSQFKDIEMAGYIGDLIVKDPAKLEETMRSIPGSSSAAAALGSAALSASPSNPALARQLLELIPGERLRGNVAVNIVAKMAQEDPKAAAKWAASISEPLTKQAALNRLKQFGVQPM